MTHAAKALLLTLLLLLVAGSGPMAATYYASGPALRGSFTDIGSASRVDLRLDSFELAAENETFTVFADRAVVQLQGGRRGELGDITEGALVRVYGERLSRRTVRADEIVVLDTSGRLGNRAHGYRPYERLELRGYVTRVFPRSGEINIRADGENVVLTTRPSTIIRRYIYVTDIYDISEGDEITAYGKMTNRDAMDADRIQILKSGRYDGRDKGYSRVYRPTGTRYVAVEDTVDGYVITTPSSFDRTIVLRTEFGERKVDVAKSAEVIRSRKPASLHDLQKGEAVRVVGAWDGSTLMATRVEVIDARDLKDYTWNREKRVPDDRDTRPQNRPSPEQPSPAPSDANSRTGRIIAIDYDKSELTMDADMTDVRVDASGAEVTRKGSTRRFSDLKKGDKVTVTGELKNGAIEAESVELVD